MHVICNPEKIWGEFKTFFDFLDLDIVNINAYKHFDQNIWAHSQE